MRMHDGRARPLVRRARVGHRGVRRSARPSRAPANAPRGAKRMMSSNRRRRRGVSIALTLLGLGAAIACTARPGERVGSTEAPLEPEGGTDASAGAPLAEVLVWDRVFQPMPD